MGGPPELSSSFVLAAGVALGVYAVALFGLGLWANRQVHDAEDYIVAGRRLGLPLSVATLLATWFGAGTLLTATDEIRAEGLSKAALDPIGAGICLLLAGWWFAKPLRDLELVTLADLFQKRFGPRAEVVSALLLVPSYLGWIAAQLVALAGVLELLFGIPAAWGIAIAAGVGLGYTLLGGMWSVAITDAVQMVLIVIGAGVLVYAVAAELGHGDAAAGAARVFTETSPEARALVPTGSLHDVVAWLGILAVGALGNLPGQDLMQRVFSARTSTIARRACFWAGGLYLTFGLMPMFLGLAARLTGAGEGAVLPLLAGTFLPTALGVIVILALVSAVLSTLDSAVLSPASVLAENVLDRALPRHTALFRVRACVVLVTAGSVGMAYSGESAYALLEDAYALPLAGLFVPMAAAVWRVPRTERSGLAAMLVGAGAWALHYTADAEYFLGEEVGRVVPLPVALSCAALSLLAYAVSERLSVGPQARS